MRRLASLAFGGSLAALVYAQAGYPLLLAAIARVRGRRAADGGAGMRPEPGTTAEPVVSLIVAAHREADVIAGKVANALALDWPRDRLEVIVACDGSPDDTPARARAAGADRVLDLPWGGKIRAQDAAVAEARGDLLAFSDANALWEPDALRALVARFADPGVGYVCGQVRFVSDGGTNQEGLYWRYEMAIRGLESDLASVTAGNGAIYAVRPEAYVNVDPVMGHDLTLPFTLVKRGWRAVYAPDARASEKMVPTIEGEFARKRRMMSHMWPIVLRGGMLSPRGYPPLYALMIGSHRVLRYVGPFLHVVALLASIVLRRGRAGTITRAALAAQAALLGAAAAGGRVRSRPLLVARYYVLTTASIAAGLWDHLRHGTVEEADAREGGFEEAAARRIVSGREWGVAHQEAVNVHVLRWVPQARIDGRRPTPRLPSARAAVFDNRGHNAAMLLGPAAPRTADAAEVMHFASDAARRGLRVVLATVASRKGSAPATEGRNQACSEGGEAVGTVGGGAVEREVLQALEARLASNRADARLSRTAFQLGPELGMCCGGSVEVVFEEIVGRSPLLVVGAGHVAQALVPLLVRLRFAVTVADERSEWLDRVEAMGAGVACVLGDHREAGKALPRRAAVLAMCHDHRLDEEAIGWALTEGFALVGTVVHARRPPV